MQQLIGKSIEFNNLLFLCFVNLTSAFDRVRLTHVIQCLRKNKFDENLMKIIKELNSSNRTRIKTEQGLTEEISTISKETASARLSS